jgi:predicted dehydrogenase
LSRFIFDGEPTKVLGTMNRDVNTGCDYLTSAIMEFGLATSTFTCGTLQVPYQRVNIFGTTGRIEIEIPFNAPTDRPCRLWLQTTTPESNPTVPEGERIEEIVFDTCNQYTLQADVFGHAILDGTAFPTPLTDAVQNMRVIDKILLSTEMQDWEAM